MEGLIPVVYKSLRKKKIQRRYECLSSGAAQSYNVEEFYHHDQEMMNEGGLRGALRRRCNSVHVDRTRSFASIEDDAYKPKLMRFRSYRVLSCLSAA